MDDILLNTALRDKGFAPDELARMLRAGSLNRVRRGAYLPGAQPAELTAEQRHLQLVLATAPQLRTGAVISHTSAAVLHGLPVWPDNLRRVQLTRDRNYGAKKRNLVEVHGASLPPDAVTEVSGVPVTTLARTVLDLGRTLPFEQSVAAGDRALALGLQLPELASALLDMKHWPGVRAARRLVPFVDGLSESVGESVSRVRFLEGGLPAPSLQREIFDADGVLIGRVDFCWEDELTIGEFDGRVKYGRLREAGQSIEDIVFAEKRREDLLRDLGWQVVRWLWADLYHGHVVRDRVLRAFARARGHQVRAS